MAIGLPATYKLKKKYTGTQTDAYLRAEQIMVTLGWMKIGYLKDQETYHILDYKTIGTWLTFAERVMVYIGQSEILVVSECMFPAQFMDFGKNKRNVDQFFSLFEQANKAQ